MCIIRMRLTSNTFFIEKFPEIHPLNVSQIVPQIGFVSIHDCSYVTAYRFLTEIETEQRQMELFFGPTQ